MKIIVKEDLVSDEVALRLYLEAVKPRCLYGRGYKAKIIISIRYLVVWNNFCIFTKNKRLA